VGNGPVSILFWPIPLSLTDLGPIDPVVVMGRGRYLFRIADLLELCSLIEVSTLG